MKYEAVFGDQKRFNEQNNEIAEVMLWHDRLGPNFVSIKELSRMNLEGAIPHGSVVLAMRRIIAEPNRWTWEDKKAGRLPEVGCYAIWHDDNGMKYTVKIETVFFGNECAVSIDDEAIYFAEKFCLFPIETPAEKAQREEDEFVDAIVSEYNKMPSPISFNAGIRAAYRKLKGGE